MKPVCWVNGVAADSLSVLDRGLHYGDGLFETLPVKAGRIPLLGYHLDRLYAGCQNLQLPGPARGLLHDELLSAAAGAAQAVLKLILTRGSDGRGYRPAAETQTTRILTRYAWPAYPTAWPEQGIRLRICATRLGHNPRLAGLKHLNRLEQVLARMEWPEADPAQEGLMLDQDGAVIEGTMTNVFARLRDGVLTTPDLTLCGVAGVMRRQVLERAEQNGVPVRIATLSLTELMHAQEIFVCNSLVGVWPVTAIGEQGYAVGSLTRQAQAWAAQC